MNLREAVVTKSRYCAVIYLKRLNGNHEIRRSFHFAGVPADIRTENLPGASRERYRYANPFGC
jgi:hypothetical protein